MSVIQHLAYNPEQQKKVGSKFMIANGYMGYRGTLDEADSSDFVALNLAGLYDGSRFIENVNLFNPLYTLVKADGIDLNPKSFRPLKHSISLNTDNGLFSRETEFKYGTIKITLKSERFMDQTNLSNMYAKFSFVSNSAIDIELFSGIDDYIWNINEHHLVDNIHIDEKGMNIVSSKTKHNEIPVVIGLLDDYDFKMKPMPYRNGLKKSVFTLEPKKTYTIYKYVSVCHTNEDSLDKVKINLLEAKKTGYESLLEKNNKFWEDIYLDSKVNVFNNPEVMNISDYAIYQLISHRPYSDNVSVNQKGLSGQFENGSVGWNTEILILPFYTNTLPNCARHMVMYRINSLETAMKKASDLGYEGAFYSEGSGEEGIELNNHTLINNIHINGSIVYGLYQYIERSKDYSILFNGGLDMMLECSRFYLSYATLSENKKHYDFLNVMGLDNTHDAVDNEAYTNLIIKNCLDSVIKCVAFAKAEDKFKVKDMFAPKNYEKLITEIRELRRKLYTKKENIEYLVEGYDKYFNLEDRNISMLKRVSFLTSVEDEDVINTTYIKNANVLAVLALFLDEYSNKVKSANYDYYLRRSVNPDVFTRIMYVIVGCACEKTEEAYKQFIDLADLDLSNEFMFESGLNLSLLGGIYSMLVYGFAGLRHHGFLLSGDYNDAAKIRRLEFKVMIAKNRANVKTKRNSVTISWKDE